MVQIWALGVTLIVIYLLGQRVALATETEATPISSRHHGSRPNLARPPGLSIEPYIRPEMGQRMQRLRPAILAAASRHNREELSGMSDQQFALVMVTILYNEHFGWFEEDIAPLRAVTPLYQDLQRRVNASGVGGDFSVWPANLRPSVALEILRGELPLADGRVAYVPVHVLGSQIDVEGYASREALLAAITDEISRDDLAVEYLAANLERGLYRAAAEGAPVSWRTLAAWHNQGIVCPQAARANPTAHDYLRRAAAYLPAAKAFLHQKSLHALALQPI
ncbi:hypothetical protein OSCT_0636 [Oscillochloris trichoides DG-6]|uniref:Uncharacterized protein n=1 Tax=Oscillochloris trichoides DG-6 TaxID=765420 RepID=E1IBD5_9CHLR|nr:hypothetical protein OSCT_0636 [Oscillochloris trichoides DG-6]